MSLRVRVSNGDLVPLDPLPVDWHEGDPFATDRNGGEDVERNDEAAREELTSAVSEISDEDFARDMAPLDKHRREAKDSIRTRMGPS